jgi:hypothetical protein
MKCRYCSKTLAPLRSLTDGEFCCDEHRSAFEWEASKAADPTLSDPEFDELPAVTLQNTMVGFREHGTGENGFAESAEDLGAPSHRHLSAFEYGPVDPNSLSSLPTSISPEADFSIDADFPPAEIGAEAFAAEPEPVSDAAGLNGLAAAKARYEDGPEEDFDLYEEQAAEAPFHPVSRVASTWRWLTAVWKTAPFELKVITLLLPVLLAVAVSPSRPQIHVPSGTETKMRKMLDDRWKVMQQNISNRAAVVFTDDFRSGLDAWNSHSKLTSTWSYDAAGFVEPGPLAIFKPTLDLTDYRFEYLGEIDQRAMGFAFRAKNLDNYYAVKFVIVKPGPLPIVHILRYAVINGRQGPRVEKPLPLTARADMFYRVAVDVRGGDFTLTVQDQVVDFWSDNRLRQGGVGFFCDRGERARLRWVEVTYQYDTLGKLCAFLAPYGMEESN